MRYLFSLLCLSYTFLAEAQKAYEFKPDGAGNIFLKNDGTIKGGDTIFLPAKGHSLYLGNLIGSPGKPIYIRPAKTGSTLLTAGMDLENAQFIDMDGGTQKAIQINSGRGETDRKLLPDGQGIKIHGKAGNIRVNGVEFRNLGYAFWIKNEANCDPSINAWTIRNVEVSNCYMENFLFQMAYVGSTDAEGKLRQINCGGKVMNVKPGGVGGIRFINNVIKKTGRAAIQISVAFDSLMSEVAYNVIEDAGLERSGEQGNGINIGGFSRVNVHHNQINRTFVAGIAATGAAEVIIEDNTINNSGYLFPESPTVWAWGVWIATRSQNQTAPMRFKVNRNKIGQRGQGGPDDKGYQDIIIAEDASGFNFQNDNELSGNISTITSKEAVVKIDPRIKYKEMKQPAPEPETPSVPGSDVVREWTIEGMVIQFMKDGSVRWRRK